MSEPTGSTTDWIPITPGASITESLVSQINAIGTAAAASATAAAASAASAAASLAAIGTAVSDAEAAASAAAASASGAFISAENAIGYAVTASSAASSASASASSASGSASSASTSATAAAASASAASTSATAAASSATAAASSASAASTSATASASSATAAAGSATSATASATTATTQASNASTSATAAATSATAAATSATAAASSATAAAASAASIHGLPTGGTTGQVLAKNSSTNYDASFVDAAGGITGLTTGKIPKAASSTTLTDSVVTEASGVWSGLTALAIGTSTATSGALRLALQSTVQYSTSNRRALQFGDSINDARLLLGHTGETDQVILNDGVTFYCIDGSGNTSTQGIKRGSVTGTMLINGWIFDGSSNAGSIVWGNSGGGGCSIGSDGNPIYTMILNTGALRILDGSGSYSGTGAIRVGNAQVIIGAKTSGGSDKKILEFTSGNVLKLLDIWSFPTSDAAGFFKSNGSGTLTLTALAASDIASGTIATARLGSGTADSTTVLYGDQTYKAAPAAAGWTTNTLASDFTLAGAGYAATGIATATLVNANKYRVRGLMRFSSPSTGSIGIEFYSGGNFITLDLAVKLQTNVPGVNLDAHINSGSVTAKILVSTGDGAITTGYLWFDGTVVASSNPLSIRVDGNTTTTVLAGSYIEWAHV